MTTGELERRIRDARIHVERARDAARSGLAIPPHRADTIRTNLRFAHELLDIPTRKDSSHGK